MFGFILQLKEKGKKNDPLTQLNARFGVTIVQTEDVCNERKIKFGPLLNISN